MVIARLDPVHKSGLADDQSNYKPIVSVFAFLFEKIVYDQIHSFLNDSKPGFRSMHSVLS